MELDDLIKELEQNPNYADNLSEEQLVAMEKKLNPYGATIYGDERYTCLSFTNLREQYLTKLLTTALIGFTYQMCKEHDTDLEPELDESDFTKKVPHPDFSNKELMDKIYNEQYNLQILDSKSEEDASLFARKYIDSNFGPVDVTDRQAMDIESERLKSIESANEREVIKRFLNKHFKFDPNTHVANSFKGSEQDPEREQKPDIHADLLSNVPAETYNRFQLYYDVNYDHLRDAVRFLYAEKPDIEVAVNVYGTFDSLDEASKFVDKNKEKVITNVLTVTTNKWNLIGSFKENRDRVNFYNKNTVILENIIKQRESDAKIGKELLSKRVRKMKAKNIKKYGKDHPNFVKYKKQHLDGVYDTSITKITEEDDELVVERSTEYADTGAAIDEDGVPEDSLEIKVTKINAATNEINQQTIYTKAQAPNVTAD